MSRINHLHKALIILGIGIILCYLGYLVEKSNITEGARGGYPDALEKALRHKMSQFFQIFFGLFGSISLYFLLKHFGILSKK